MKVKDTQGVVISVREEKGKYLLTQGYTRVEDPDVTPVGRRKPTPKKG